MIYKVGFFHIKNQSPFIMIITGVMAFLSILCLSVVLSLSGAVLEWSKEWKNNATIQIIPNFNDKNSLQIRDEQVNKIFKQNKHIIKNIEIVPETKKESLIKPWISISSNLNEYMPIMYDIEFKPDTDKKIFIKQIENINNVRFMTHHQWHNDMNELGQRIIFVALILFTSVFFVTMFAVAFACKTSMDINKREIEIFDIVGAYDMYIANQFARMILIQTLIGGIAGFFTALPIIGTIISVVSKQQIGLTGMIRAENWHLAVLFLVPIIISFTAIHIAKQTVLKKLKGMDNNV